MAWGRVPQILNMIAIGTFFASIGFKSGTLKDADARRRLRLMLWGSQISLSPIFVVVLIAVVRNRRPFVENSRLAAAVAAEAARRERINRELEIAREVQERFFPQTHPEVSGLEYAGQCRPALGVGGDYYDFLGLPSGGFGFAIGDVSGKGSQPPSSWRRCRPRSAVRPSPAPSIWRRS